MRADIRYIRPGLSNEAKYDVINMLPVSFEQFADQSHLQWRTYGVLTGDSSGYTGPEGEELVSYVLNRCARLSLYKQLLEECESTEKIVGYKLSERYLTLDEPYRGPKIALPHPGVSSLEVTRSWYYTDLMVSVDFYLEENLTIFVDAGTTFVRVSAELFENPRWAILRNITTGKVLVQDTGSPRYAEYDALNNEWLIPIVTRLSPVIITDTVHGQHRKYVKLVVSKPLPVVAGLPLNAVFTAVYPGSNQILPLTTLSEDNTEIVYLADIWLLVSPAFSDETVNWERFEIHKFYREIPFAYYAETASYLRLIWGEGKCKTVYQYDPTDPDAANLPRLEAVLMDSARGIVHLVANNKLVEDLSPYWRACCECDCQTMPNTVTIQLPYKVEPQYLPERLYSQIEKIEKAILHKVAAELPVADCGCPSKLGFIFENQKSYDDAYMNPFTSVEVLKRKYGYLHGQLVYGETMETVQIYRRPLKQGLS